MQTIRSFHHEPAKRSLPRGVFQIPMRPSHTFVDPQSSTLSSCHSEPGSIPDSLPREDLSQAPHALCEPWPGARVGILQGEIIGIGFRAFSMLVSPIGSPWIRIVRLRRLWFLLSFSVPCPSHFPNQGLKFKTTHSTFLAGFSRNPTCRN